MGADSIARMDRDLHTAFVHTQAGWYLSSECADDGVTWSDLVDDEYWNFVVPEAGWDGADLQRQLARLSALGRKEAVYVRPDALHLQPLLEAEQFRLADQEAVLRFNGSAPSFATDLDIRGADARNSDELIEVFIKAHSGDADDLYGELSPAYVECLERSLGRPDTWHYVGYLGDEPVAVASMARWHDHMGLYNAAVLPDFRRRGFGTAMLWHRVRQGAAFGATTFFLQTVSGERVEQRYLRYGFETAYVGRIYVR